MIIMTSTPIDFPAFLVAQGPSEKGEAPCTLGPHTVWISSWIMKLTRIRETSIVHCHERIMKSSLPQAPVKLNESNQNNNEAQSSGYGSESWISKRTVPWSNLIFGKEGDHCTWNAIEMQRFHWIQIKPRDMGTFPTSEWNGMRKDAYNFSITNEHIPMQSGDNKSC